MTDRTYAPIEDYGVVGNLETCALVGPDGSVDWFPFPHVESPSIFAAVLDDEAGGRFRVGPAGGVAGSQRYRARTNVLETTFETDDGTATVTDFLPPAGRVDHPSKVLYRKVTGREGAMEMRVEFDPQFDYGRAAATLESTDRGLLAAGADERTLLESPVALDRRDDGGRGVRLTGEFTVTAGDEAWFLLRCTGAEDADADPEAALSDTAAYWRNWTHDCAGDGDCAFAGPWHDLVVRSALALKLLTHVDSGAIAAAPTTSLPEDVGGVRNWDYRYNWLRDAGFTVQALANLGHFEQARDYLEWFLGLCQADDPGKLRPVYGLHGDADLAERELDHLAGYRGSRPVRVGNAAADQRQLDVYGELLLAVDEMLRHGRELSAEEWDAVRGVVEHVREAWDRPDAGIWEVRGGPVQFVHSKVMCWVALDRGVEIATERDREAPIDAWRECRETVRADVLERGYDEDLGAFVQSYGSDALDATGLLVPVVGFLPFDDDRVRGTIEAVEARLVAADGLVRRYDGDDGLPGGEGAFLLCSFWLVDALALSGRVEEARRRFEAIAEYVNPLGLLAEEVDSHTGAYLGNYPQAFSHVGVVNSVLYLGYVRGADLPGPPPMGVRLGEPAVDAGSGDGSLEPDSA